MCFAVKVYSLVAAFLSLAVSTKARGDTRLRVWRRRLTIDIGISWIIVSLMVLFLLGPPLAH